MHYDCDHWIVIRTTSTRKRQIGYFPKNELLDNEKRDLYLSSGHFLSDIGNESLNTEIQDALVRTDRFLSKKLSDSPETWSTGLLRGTVRIVVTGVKR